MKKPNELNSIPDRLADDLVGRVADIDKIHELLFKDAQRVAIKGIGGLGKTSVAQAYIRKYRSYFDNIAYIQVILPPNQDTLTDSEFIEKIQQGFAYDTVLLKNLGIELDPKTLDVDIYIELCQKLTHHTGEHNLLVIDNTGAILTRFIDHLPKSPDWHILTTSRHDIDNFKTYPLSTLPFEEAEMLFKNLYGEEIDDANALKFIFEAVGYLTVAIDLLAKTARSADLSVTSLRERVQAYSLDFKDAAKVKAGRFNESKTPAEHIIERYVLQELNEDDKYCLLAFAVLPSLPILFNDMVTWLHGYK